MGRVFYTYSIILPIMIMPVLPYLLLSYLSYDYALRKTQKKFPFLVARPQRGVGGKGH